MLNLFDYQMSALDRMHNGCILCGGVGSGKSRTALAYYYTQECGGMIFEDGSKIKKVGKIHKSLFIITTAKKRDSLEWERELIQFALSTENKSWPVVIDSWNNIKKYADAKNSFFIFDEQRVVGTGAWSKAFIKISRNNHWILLSATPGDTWMDYMSVFIANGFYRNMTDFRMQHVVYSRYSKYPKVQKYINTGKLIRERNDILVTMDFERETIQHHDDVICDYDKSEYLKASKFRWDEQSESPIENASKLCYILRKIVNESDDRIEKAEYLLKNFDRIIVFYNFDYERDILIDICKRNKLTYAEWNGHEHNNVPRKLKWVYLVQYTAGCEGWNCVETNIMIFYSQNYSYKVVTQASGRIDRVNTEYRDLYYYHLRSNSPIDISIARALKKKQNFNESSFADSMLQNSHLKHRL